MLGLKLILVSNMGPSYSMIVSRGSQWVDVEQRNGNGALNYITNFEKCISAVWVNLRFVLLDRKLFIDGE